MALARPSQWDPSAAPVAAGRTLCVDEFSLATASLDELEATTRAIGPEWSERRWSSDRGLEELVVLRTCHRIEIVQLRREGSSVPLPGPRAGWRHREGYDALEHLYRVAEGLESLARGEREVLEQVRLASRRIRSRLPRPILGEMFREILRATEPAEGRPSAAPRSVASIAAARLLAEIGAPFPRILVVGSGVVGRQITEALGPYARTTIVYRRSPPPDALLRASGARAVPLAELAEELPLCDGLIAAAKTGERLLGPLDLEGRRRPLTMIDLGVPRNIDPATRANPGVRLFDLEALYRGRAHGATEEADEGPIRERARAGFRRLAPLLDEPGLDAVMRDAEALRQREVEQALPHLGALSAAQRASLELLSQRLVRRLLVAPVERIRSMPPGPARDRALASLAELVRADARP